MIAGAQLLEALPVAVYTTDADGRITFYNEAAAQLWGRRPELGTRWCGSWRLYWPDGRPMPYDACAMAVTLREGRPVRGFEAVAERPGGARVPFIPYPSLLRDASGRVLGAINLLVDIAERKRAEIESARLAAIVASSDDAIISKTLDGRITSWNAGATRIFGYEPDEIIGQSITRVVPPELLREEEEILAKLQRGERIDHYDTVRVAKDGRRIDVSLTVSPLRDTAGKVIGASKVARDITERKQREELQRLLFDELRHRVKNTLAAVQAIASQSLRGAASPSDFVASFSGRVQALARAHDLLAEGKMKGAELMEIVREQVAFGAPDGAHVACSGPRVTLDAQPAVQLALVLHELATNARKYGALSAPTGQLSISWKVEMHAERELFLEWRESGVPQVSAPRSRGFGTTLIERSLESTGGEAAIRYGADGVVCQIKLPLPEEPQQSVAIHAAAAADKNEPKAPQQASPSSLRGKRILLVDDEPLLVMEVESQLACAGYEVVGPAGTLESARQLIAEATFDAALIDANLTGHPVHELAAALTQKGIPFAFATGYGRDALPVEFRQAPVLTKPFSPNQLLAEIEALLRAPAALAELHERGKAAPGRTMRILVVEDEPVIAQDVAWVLEEEVGYAAARTASSVQEALALIAAEHFDGAVLDANLHGVSAERVAEALREQNVPFFVLSGCLSQKLLPAPLRDAPILYKPYLEDELVLRLRSLAHRGDQCDGAVLPFRNTAKPAAR